MTDVRRIQVLERDAAGRFTPHVLTRREHILDRAVRSQASYGNMSRAAKAFCRLYCPAALFPGTISAIRAEFSRLWAAQ